LSAPQFQLHKILWVAVSSTVGLSVERRHHLQSVWTKVDQTDENRLGLSLVGQCYSIPLQPRLSPKRILSDDDDELMTTLGYVGALRQCKSRESSFPLLYTSYKLFLIVFLF
ncbi:hypothetical protein AVEN_142747-1, partial [Araneus ventricosus]